MNLPNLLTLFRIALSILSGYEYYRGNVSLAFFLFVLAGISDLLDGFIARRYNLVSDLGKLLDPLSDKIMLITGLWCLVYSKILPGWFLWAVIIKEAVLIMGSVYMLGEGVIVHSGKYGKTSTLLYTVGVGLGLLGIPFLATGFIAGAFCMSLITVGYYYIYFGNVNDKIKI